MSIARLFRPFRPSRRVQVNRTRARLDALKGKIAAHDALDDDDHRLIARLGPQSLRYIGYTPRVTLS